MKSLDEQLGDFWCFGKVAGRKSAHKKKVYDVICDFFPTISGEKVRILFPFFHVRKHSAKQRSSRMECFPKVQFLAFGSGNVKKTHKKRTFIDMVHY